MIVNLFDATNFSNTCDEFLGGFWDLKNVKREQNVKTISDSLKKISNNHLLETLIIYSELLKQIRGMPCHIKGSLKIYGCFFGWKHHQISTNVKNVPKYGKNNLTNTSCKNLHVYFKHQKQT